MTAKRALRPRQGILDIAPYVPGKSALAAGGPAIKLSSNETPLGASPKAIEAFKAAAGNLERYPDGQAHELREAMWQLGAAAMQVAHAGDKSQLDEAKKVLTDARKSIYRLLAAEG